MKILLLHMLILITPVLGFYREHITLKKIDVQKSIGHFEQIKLSQLGKEIVYIHLGGSNSNHFLEKISYLDFSQKKICICDFHNCYLFNKNGGFEKKIGRQGKGPGEYIHISGMCFSEINSIIYISSDYNINKYSFDGDFIKSIPLQNVKTDDGFMTPIRPWLPISNSLFLGNIPNYSGTQKINLVVFDENGHLIKEFKNYQMYNNGFNMANTWDISTSFYRYGGGYTIKKLKNDTLFRMTKTLATYPDYIFSFGKYRPPFENGYNSVKEFFREIVNYITLNSLLESKDYFFLTCDFGKYTSGYEVTKTLNNGQDNTYKNTLVKGLYNKITDQITFLQPSQTDGFINDIDGGLNFFPQKILNDSIMVSWVDAYQLKAHVASETFKSSTPKYPEKKKQLEELANSLQENDNPVLMLVKLK